MFYFIFDINSVLKIYYLNERYRDVNLNTDYRH